MVDKSLIKKETERTTKEKNIKINPIFINFRCFVCTLFTLMDMKWLIAEPIFIYIFTYFQTHSCNEKGNKPNAKQKNTLINFTQYISRHTQKKLGEQNWVKKIWAAIEQKKTRRKKTKRGCCFCCRHLSHAKRILFLFCSSNTWTAIFHLC